MRSRARPRNPPPRRREARRRPPCARSISAVDQRRVLDHVRERLARRDLAVERQEGRPHRVLQLGIGDHHVEDRLRARRRPRPRRRWSRTAAAPPPRSPRRARRRAWLVPSAGSATVDLERIAEPLAQRDRQRQAGEAAAGDQHIDAVRLCRPLRTPARLSCSHRPRRMHHWLPRIKVPPCPPPSTTCSTILDLEQLEVNLFRGRSPQVGWQRVFGGQVIGQALVAAAPHRRGRAAAFAARLFPAGRRPEGADHLRRRPHPRRQELHHAARGRDPARPGDLLDVGVVPRRRAGPRPSVPRCRTCRRPEQLPSDAEIKQNDPAADAGAGAPLLRARAADRAAPGRVRPLLAASKIEDGRFNVWIRTTGRCPTIRRSTTACWPMPPT